MKKIYFSMTTHPNMNYDRSLRSVIWEEFPKLYRLYLNYLRDNPPLKTHMQLPPQTLLSLKQCAPDVLEMAQRIRAEGRLKFMGTFFSESIAQCQDGMSVLDAAELGCGIASAELDAELEGFFLQEIAYTPQLPYVIDQLGVQWTILRDWEDSAKPFWVEGLDGQIPPHQGLVATAIRPSADSPSLFPSQSANRFFLPRIALPTVNARPRPEHVCGFTCGPIITDLGSLQETLRNLCLDHEEKSGIPPSPA